MHAAGVFSAANSRTVYLDGAAGATNTTSRTPASLATVLTGKYHSSAGTDYSDVAIAETAIWDVALSADEITSLSKGLSPILIRPQNLVFYAPIVGANSPEIELVGARNLTFSGSPVKAEHPRIIRPSAKILTFPSAGGSSLNVSATTDALTLAEYAATIGKSLNISATTDALTLAEYAATVGSAIDISATTDALTLAEYAATIGLSLNVQATTDALTLAEYPASLGNTQNVQATTDALTLAEYPATLSFALNVSAMTDALVLAEYAATISDGTAVAQNPSTGGGRPGRTYAYPSEPKKRRKAPEKPQEKTSVPEETAKPYEVAGRLGAITDVPDNVVQLPVLTASPVVTGSLIDPVVPKTLEELVDEAVKKAMAEYQAVQDGEKILKQFEKEEAELSLGEVECLLLLAMVE